MGSKDQDLEAYGNQPSLMLETRDVQSDVVPSTSSARMDTPRDSTADPGAAEDDIGRARVHDDKPEISDADLPPARPRVGPSRSATTTMATMSTADPLPESIGRETCPSCIVDLKDGDDVRVLPCEANTNSIRRVSTGGCSNSRAPVQSAVAVRKAIPNAISFAYVCGV